MGDVDVRRVNLWARSPLSLKLKGEIIANGEVETALKRETKRELKGETYWYGRQLKRTGTCI